ncbi:MAG: tetratricopeptide repeat protein [Flavobacteriaceae bacterium]|nr:tetratricopeptide repeat protein [Flavobacteriaceae bacterium]MDG2350030.1 tetratricopeptide repeat protein [Flavobacteriaceae bacterium]
MKQIVVLSLAFIMSVFSFAQKKELKEVEKALKSNNFADAKSLLGSAEAMLGMMDDKTKAKFYFLKGQVLYANGTGSDDDVSDALKNFKLLRDTEKASGKMLYTTKVNAMNATMTNDFITKAQNALSEKNYEVSYKNFDNAYRSSTSDTLYLYNAALLATSNKSYDTAITLFTELQEMGYTGISTTFNATDKASGEEQLFPSASLRDISVKMGTHSDPKDVVSESKVGDIAKNIALIYIEKGETDKALAAIDKAKATNPNDFNLILAEANVRYKLGQTEEYKSLVSKALSINPDNVDLLFNLGVVSAEGGNYEEAKSFYLRAIAQDDTYNRARMNLVAMLFDQVQGYVDEMNNLGTSAADDKRYNELNEVKNETYREAIPLLEGVLVHEPNSYDAAKTLMEIFSVLDDMPNFEKMKAKVDTMQKDD